MNTSINSDVVIVKKRTRESNRNPMNRLSLGSSTTAYAGHLGSIVFGKIKSLWSAHSTIFNSGLNQLAGRS